MLVKNHKVYFRILDFILDVIKENIKKDLNDSLLC